jgi:hypothetical protein
MVIFGTGLGQAQRGRYRDGEHRIVLVRLSINGCAIVRMIELYSQSSPEQFMGQGLYVE